MLPSFLLLPKGAGCPWSKACLHRPPSQDYSIMPGFPCSTGFRFSFLSCPPCPGSADLAALEDCSMQTTCPERVIMSRSLKRQRIRNRMDFFGRCPHAFLCGGAAQGSILEKQECFGWPQNSAFAKISNLWQRDIYGNMSCRDSLAWKSTIYKNRSRFRTKNKVIPNLWLPDKFQMTSSKSEEAPERAVVR